MHTGRSAVKTQDQGDMGPGKEEKACISRFSAKHEKSGEFLLALAHPGTFATRGRPVGWLRCVQVDDRRSFLFVLLICLAELIELNAFALRTY